LTIPVDVVATCHPEVRVPMFFVQKCLGSHS
jgi:hypothetical protein